MDSLYDIYLTGKLAEGLSNVEAGARLAQLLKADRITMTALITGKPQLLKRGADRALALKFRDALTRIGIGVAFKARTVEPQYGLSLAPLGTDVLSPAERSRVEPAAVDTRSFSVAPVGAELHQSRPEPAPPAPDIDHLSLTAADSDLLHPDERAAPAPAPVAAGDWDLAPAGAVLETLPRAEAAPAAAPHWSLAPVGADLGDESGPATAPPVPDTGHLRLQDLGA